MDLLILLMMVLINVAFITLLERKILGYSQNRLGPNKPSLGGLFQPGADAFKLFFKTYSKILRIRQILFFVGPIFNLTLMLWIWTLVLGGLNIIRFTFSSIFFITILRLNVYPVFLRGWSSGNKFSIMGAMRSIAQTISYEISLAVLVFIVILYLTSLSLNCINTIKSYFLFVLILPHVIGVWLISRVAETNRAPFDFAEGERELVSGFNVEYGAAGFALIFIAEYGRIYFLRHLTALIFLFKINSLGGLTGVTLAIFLWIWVRRTLPRHRYDLLINLAWKSILPISLSLVILILRLKLF